MSDEPLPMMQGKFKELKKMTVAEKNIEIEAWRNLWSYVPSEVKGSLAAAGVSLKQFTVCTNLPPIGWEAAHQILSIKKRNDSSRNHAQLQKTHRRTTINTLEHHRNGDGRIRKGIRPNGSAILSRTQDYQIEPQRHD